MVWSRKYYVDMLFAIMFLNSCVITRTPGFYSGYKRLSDSLKKKIIIVPDKETIPLIHDYHTYAITAKHLKYRLQSNSKSIVYFWSPNCSGSVCISLRVFQKFCSENGYKPIIVAEYYDFEQLEIQGVKQSSVFAINHWHYGTDYCNTYLRRFKESLFKEFKMAFNPKSFDKYIYFDGKTISTNKPFDLSKYPWQ